MLERKTNSKNQSRLSIAGKLLLAIMISLPLVPAAQPLSVQAAPSIELKNTEILTSGAVLKSYVWSTERKGTKVSVNAKVVEVDLHNPNVKVDVMTGTNNQFTKKQTVMGMATETGAVAGTNGDFYNTQAEGVPIGPQIADGKLMATPPYLPGFYTFAITKDRKPLVDQFTFTGQIIAKDGTTYPLGGINKTYYWLEPSGTHTMIDGLFMYTNSWGQVGRSNDGVTVPSEVLVVNNVVTQIKDVGIIDMIPPKDGYILRSSGKAAEFVREHMKVGDVIKADYNVLALDPSKSYDYKNFQMMIGGHTILVDGGQPAAFSRKDADASGFRSRTAIGYSKDERYVYLITADNSGDSKGLSFADLQDFMIKVGVWKGINLDGGGSTQMVARPLGETALQLVNATEYGSQRQVVNGVGVFSLAPKGQVKGLKVEGPETLLLGEKVTYSLKGYDEYYNPVSGNDIQPVWSPTTILRAEGGNTFTALTKGTSPLKAQAGLATETKNIRVIGREDLAQLKLEASPAILREGEDVTLKAAIKTTSGEERQVPAELLKWEIRGIKGTITNGKLHVDSLNGAKMGQLIASYDGYSSILPLTVGETKLFADFDTMDYKISFAGTSGVTGVAVRGTSEAYSGGVHGHLEYDLSKGSGTKAAYAVIGNKDAVVPGDPQAIQLKVKGDNSLNWLRAEFIDAEGDTNLVDLAKSVNWTGWKTITADLSSKKMVSPIKLTRIYIVSVEQSQDERSLKGVIDFDNISFQYKGAIPQLARNQVKLTIDKPTITINGGTQTVDQAPVIVAGNTLVPIRFVSEALGGEVTWDENERRVTVLRGGQLMDFWLGQKDYLGDGVRKTAEVSPELRNERTMVPLRVLSEHLGWLVSWDEKTRTVTLE